MRDVPMTQDIIEWVLLLGLVGLIWVMALAMLDDNHRSHDKRQGSASPGHVDGYEPGEHSPQQSRATV